uniref:DDE-1 domain-containing protein n=1 Tax=Trichuris muris TaxID=70415 RepID=A0A5S6QV63_TRIMR
MGVKSLPVAYGHQKKAWMNFKLVEDWMKKVFVPEVKRYQEAIGKTGEVLLLIDNAVIDLLNSVDELVTIKFFPPNVISLIQPMDQGVIRSFKDLYRKVLPV